MPRLLLDRTAVMPCPCSARTACTKSATLACRLRPATVCSTGRYLICIDHSLIAQQFEAFRAVHPELLAAGLDLKALFADMSIPRPGQEWPQATSELDSTSPLDSWYQFLVQQQHAQATAAENVECGFVIRGRL